MGGDEPAFESLHRRIGPGLRRMLAARMPGVPAGGGSEADLDDLCQRAWVAIWNALRTGTYEPERAAFTTFAYAVAYRTWLYHARQSTAHRQRFAAVEVDESIAGPLGKGTEAEADFARLLDALRAVLRGESAEPLSPDDRALLRAIAEGESDRAMAARLGLSPSTANARKQAALGKVRRLLSRLGFAADSAERARPTGKQPE